MAINTRSPYFLSIGGATTASATLDLTIWSGAISPVPTTKEYELKKSVISGGSTVVNFEISELVRDYLEVTFNGTYSGAAVYVYYVLKAFDLDNVQVGSTQSNTLLGFDSYSYFEEPLFDISDSSLMMSNRKMFVLAGKPALIPVNSALTPSVEFYSKGQLLSTKSISSTTNSNTQIQYVSFDGLYPTLTPYKDRVQDQAEGGIYESNACIISFFDSLEDNSIVDSVKVTDSTGVYIIDVETIEECRYEPKKLTFINKYGALQDVIFFKKFVKKMDVKKESYKANILTSSNTYSTSSHVKRDFNIIGSEKVTISSGWLTEEYNEVFKQMMLSEKVWITNVKDGVSQVLPLNVITSDLSQKTSLNDKLIEYTIEFENSYDTINNIR